MEAFFKTYTDLVEHTNAPVRRSLMDEIDWDKRMIGIRGTRGVGKTTFLLQYAKEQFGAQSKKCLYVNMNSFYFQGQSVSDFACMFYANGGQVLLIDQVFKLQNWGAKLRECYDRNPHLRIVFTASSVIPSEEDCKELDGIVKYYDLRGFSLREYVNLLSKSDIPIFSLSEILEHPKDVERTVTKQIEPANFFIDYLRHGFYPFFLEKRNFSENLLKTMNMMVEVDVLLIKRMELKYLSRIKKLIYLLSTEKPKSPNISQLAKMIKTSRATVMNYIKYLSEAGLVNIIYHAGEVFPKKPAKVMMDNTNLMYAICPLQFDIHGLEETFLVSSLQYDHCINHAANGKSFVIDGMTEVKIAPTPSFDNAYVIARNQQAKAVKIPLWMFGLVY